MEITLGSTITKPVETQEQCTAYAAMAEAVNAHNAACAVGDMRIRPTATRWQRAARCRSRNRQAPCPPQRSGWQHWKPAKQMRMR